MTDIPEDYTREQLWTKYQTAEHAMREFQERNSNQARQIRGFKAALKHCISKTARSVELIEDDVITGDLGALNELNELVVYIAGQLNPRKEA